MLDRLEASPIHALFFQRAAHAYDHAVLLWAARGDELPTFLPLAHARGHWLAMLS